MATKLSRATGNWLTNGTWETIDATSFVNSESATGVVTTSYTASAGATTGVITATGIGLKLSVRTGTTGTLSAHIAIAGVEVVGTLVTINTADLPVAATADINGGWFFLKFAAGVTLAGATTYTIEVKTSSASQISLFSTATTAWSHFISTNASAAPVAGDDVIIAGEYTGAGTSNSFVVTIDETATTDYGAAATSLVTPAVAICSKGTLKSGTTVTTNYNFKVSGNIIVYSGGEFDLGTTGTAMPRDSSMTLLLDSAANVDFGITVRNLGTFVAQGLSRTVAKLIVSCKLNTDEAIASTSLGVDTDTGWLDNDVIAVASTTRTNTDAESGSLNGAAGASTLTVDGFAGAGGGLAVAHSGTSPTQAEVILLTRNVVIQGASNSLQGYIDIKATATIDCDWTEFKFLGSATANKRGIDTACTTGTQSFQFCSLHDFVVASSRGLNMTGATGTGLTFSSNVTWKIANEHIVVASTSGFSTYDNNILIFNTSAGVTMFSMADASLVVTNNTATSGVTGFSNSDSNSIINTFTGNIAHSCSTFGLNFSSLGQNGTISTCTFWRNGSSTISQTSSGGIDYKSCIFFGQTTNITMTGISKVSDCTFNGDTTFSTTTHISLNGVADFINCDFDTVAGIKTASTNTIAPAGTGEFIKATFSNCKLAPTSVFLLGQATSQCASSIVGVQNYNRTAGSNKTYKTYGNIVLDTGTVHTGSQSIKMTPNNASSKLDSSGVFGGFKCAVANGATVTPTVYVYEDATYNGARARLIVKRNDAMGISADTVLDTRTGAADATWEAMSGATAAVTDDGTLEFVIDCDGTAGNVYVDSFTVA